MGVAYSLRGFCGGRACRPPAKALSAEQILEAEDDVERLRVAIVGAKAEAVIAFAMSKATTKLLAEQVLRIIISSIILNKEDLLHL